MVPDVAVVGTGAGSVWVLVGCWFWDWVVVAALGFVDRVGMGVTGVSGAVLGGAWGWQDAARGSWWGLPRPVLQSWILLCFLRDKHSRCQRGRRQK